MEAMRESWTDDRLDDLNGKVDALRLEMKTEFRAMNERFDKVDDRLYAMQRLMIQVYGGLFAALIAAAASLIATQL
jgi:tetrahydromethanopterin S-methyltransferase subunit G